MTNCTTIEGALASIRTYDELAGFIDQLKRPGGMPCSREQWEKIAHRKVTLQQEAGNGRPHR